MIWRRQTSLAHAGLRTPDLVARSTGSCWQAEGLKTSRFPRYTWRAAVRNTGPSGTNTFYVSVKTYIRQICRLRPPPSVSTYSCEFSTTENVPYIKAHRVSKFLATNNKQCLVAYIVGLRWGRHDVLVPDVMPLPSDVCLHAPATPLDTVSPLRMLSLFSANRRNRGLTTTHFLSEMKYLYYNQLCFTVWGSQVERLCHRVNPCRFGALCTFHLILDCLQIVQ